jgi:AraC family transcriptional activator of pobA
MADLAQWSGDPAIGALLDRLMTVAGAVDADSLARIRTLFGTILDEYIRDRVCRNTAISGSVLVLLSEVARLRDRSLSEDVSADLGGKALYRQFKSLVEAHFRDRWAMADYAAALATTERSLRRLCLGLAGQAPGRIVARRVLLEAKRNLLYTEKTVAEVGYDLGFEDPAYFTRFFARNEGETPATFRRLRQVGMVA